MQYSSTLRFFCRSLLRRGSMERYSAEPLSRVSVGERDESVHLHSFFSQRTPDPYVPKLLWSPVRSGEFRARLVLNILQRIYYSIQNYRRVPKVAAPVTFGISRPEGPQLSGGRYFRVAVTFG